MSNRKREIFHLLFQRTREVSKGMNEVLQDHELYMAQWSILFFLHTYGETSQSEISSYLNVEAPTVTRTLVRMEKSGWIARKEGKDKRERIVYLTEEAKEKFPHVAYDVQKIEKQWFAHFSAEEKEQLYQLLMKLENN